MPFGITGFKNLDTLRIAGFTHVSELSLPTESCDDLTIENCGSQAPFTLSLPNLVEVRGTLLCRNCGKAGEANSASFPRLKNVGRQLSFYVGASSFTVLEFPLLETVGNGEPVSDDPADSEDCKYWYCKYRLEAQVYLQQLLDMRMNRREFEKVSQPVFLGYYYKDSDHQDETIEVKAALNMFDELGTPKDEKRAVAFPNAGVHVIACGLSSKAIPEVRQQTFDFARQVLGMK